CIPKERLFQKSPAYYNIRVCEEVYKPAMGLPLMFMISAAVTGVSFIFFLAGFASTVWYKDMVFYVPGTGLLPGSTVGLWKACVPKLDVCGLIDESVTRGERFGELYVARLFCSVAFILIFVHVVFLVLFGFRSPLKLFATVAYCCLMAAGILNVFGPVAYMSSARRFSATVGWGGVITLLSGIAQIASAVLIIVPMRQGKIEYTTA
ncbi:hypothetical protein BaRGS_00037142, partial [Batillaria attramentaria]